MESKEIESKCNTDCKRYVSEIVCGNLIEVCKKKFRVEIGFPCAWYEKRRDLFKSKQEKANG